MKNKTVKILITTSIIILVIGILTAIGIGSSLFSKIISSNTEIIVDGSDLAPAFKIFGSIGTIAISMGIIIITIVTIASLWIIYFIIKGIKKIVIKNGKLSKTRLIIIILMIALLLTMGILLKEHNSIHWKYNILYQNGGDIYNIYKTNDDKVIVVSDIQPICIQAPCDTIKNKTKINFSESNMEIINRFIDSFFTNHEYKAINIFKENLNESQMNILNSIVYNDESLLNNKNNIDKTYTIITDEKWKTMQNDGGSYVNVYYEINGSSFMVYKIEERYYANLGGIPKTERKELYTKKISYDLINEVANTLEILKESEDVNIEKNYDFFTIEYTDYKKDIYNLETISTINKLLDKIDNY